MFPRLSRQVDVARSGTGPPSCRPGRPAGPAAMPPSSACDAGAAGDRSSRPSGLSGTDRTHTVGAGSTLPAQDRSFRPADRSFGRRTDLPAGERPSGGGPTPPAGGRPSGGGRPPPGAARPTDRDRVGRGASPRASSTASPRLSGSFGVQVGAGHRRLPRRASGRRHRTPPGSVRRGRSRSGRVRRGVAPGLLRGRAPVRRCGGALTDVDVPGRSRSVVRDGATDVDVPWEGPGPWFGMPRPTPPTAGGIARCSR